MTSAVEAFLPEFDSSAFAALRRPMWVLDHVRGRIVWANPAGAALWNAPTPQALTARDFSIVSPAVRIRTEATAAIARRGETHRERWTMYPAGNPKTVDLIVSGVRLAGEVMLLIEAAEIDVLADDVRAIEAVRHASSLLTLFDNARRPIYRNPPAIAAYGSAAFDAPMGDASAAGALWDAATERGFAAATMRVETALGPRWHALALRAVPDPATGSRALLLDERDVTDAVLANAELERLASHDGLTGLLNRAAFNARAHVACNHGAPFAIGLVDLDRFKAVNDTLGHAAGDALLVEAAARMQAAIGPGDLLARLGGDEFALLIAGPEPATRAGRVGGALIASLQRPFALSQGAVSIGASIGFALAPDHGDSADQLLLQADAALYLVKRAGRGAFRIAIGQDTPEARAA